MHRLIHSRLTKVALGLAVVGGFAAGCNTGGNDGAKSESQTQTSNYNRLVATDPAHTMQYSPTRNTINFWIDTWGRSPNAKSYVYIQDGNGKLTNHYVFVGLPVSYCAALTPTQHESYNDNGNVVLNNPSIDGVYYSGGQCNEYYGKDATTGAYVEYSIGLTQNQLVFSQPLPNVNVPSLVPSK